MARKKSRTLTQGPLLKPQRGLGNETPSDFTPMHPDWPGYMKKLTHADLIKGQQYIRRVVEQARLTPYAASLLRKGLGAFDFPLPSKITLDQLRLGGHMAGQISIRDPRAITTALHELAHYYDEEKGVSKSPEFLRAVDDFSSHTPEPQYEEAFNRAQEHRDKPRELFAYLAQGNLEALPPSLRKFYGGMFLSKGSYSRSKQLAAGP